MKVGRREAQEIALASEGAQELGEGLQDRQDGLGAVEGVVQTVPVVAQVVLFVVVGAVLEGVPVAVASQNLVHRPVEAAAMAGEEEVVSEEWAHQVHQIWLFL